MHFHLLPRKLSGDPFEGHNDQIYPALESAEETLSSHLLGIDSKAGKNRKVEPIKMDADEDRKPRSQEDMTEEAHWLKQFFGRTVEDVCELLTDPPCEPYSIDEPIIRRVHYELTSHKAMQVFRDDRIPTV